MNPYSWAWIGWIVAFLGIELTAVFLTPDKPSRPTTLSNSIWWLIQGKSRWHYAARFGLVTLLAWLSIHLLSGGKIL